MVLHGGAMPITIGVRRFRNVEDLVPPPHTQKRIANLTKETELRKQARTMNADTLALAIDTDATIVRRWINGQFIIKVGDAVAAHLNTAAD